MSQETQRDENSKIPKVGEWSDGWADSQSWTYRIKFEELSFRGVNVQHKLHFRSGKMVRSTWKAGDIIAQGKLEVQEP